MTVGHRVGGIGPVGGAGLAAQRLGLGPATLQTTVHDHVALRTPERPDHWRGNALHLFAPPADPAAALVRFDRTIGHVPGVRRRVVAWETEGTADDPGVALPHGLEVSSRQVGVLPAEAAVDPPSIPADVSLVRAGTPGQWAGAKVLYLQTDWVGDEPFWRWLVDQQRQVVEAGGGIVLVAYRFGVPVGRAGLFVAREDTAAVGDRLAAVEDVVVHPLHRGRGVGTALVLAATDVARRLLPEVRVVGRAAPRSPAADWLARLGFVPTSRSWTLSSRA